MQSLVDAPGVTTHSFRDPAGKVIRNRDRILRIVEPSFVPDLDAFLFTQTAQNAIQTGELVRTQPQGGGVYEHERIPFPSYPYEWPAEMLHAAALRTLDLGMNALDEGFCLKDATPYNVLFRGPKAVFVDLLSFERRDPLEKSWRAYGQFARTFLLPLLAQRDMGISLQQAFLAQRDGLEPEAMYRAASALQRLSPTFLGLVTLPKWLGGGDSPETYRQRNAASPEQSKFVMEGLLGRARKQLAAVSPRKVDSVWTDYLDNKSLYSPAQLAQKERFFTSALDLTRPSTLLDVGANEGHFSLLAARRGASVVAIDTDPVVVGTIWKRADKEQLNVLPLVVDLTRPTPAIGWRNQECLSFLERATGTFDLVSMLAVIHHILVTERIPVEDLLDLADQLSRGYVLLEFVGPEDPMFRKIVRGRERLYQHISRESFEAAANARFELLRSEQIDGLHRWLYLYRRRTATN